MVVGLAIGVAGAAALLPLMRRVSLPSESLYPLRTLVFAGVVYGAASVLHGSGFLAVFVAGLLLGDARAPFKGEIERFHGAVASLAEIIVFVALGLTIDLRGLGEQNVWWDGILFALVLALVARPLVVLLLLARARLTKGERLFIAWSGLKGAVPILLGTLVLLAGVTEGERIYGIVFVVVAFSVLVQGLPRPLRGASLRDPHSPAADHAVGRVRSPGAGAERPLALRRLGGLASRRARGTRPADRRDDVADPRRARRRGRPAARLVRAPAHGRGAPPERSGGRREAPPPLRGLEDHGVKTRTPRGPWRGARGAELRTL